MINPKAVERLDKAVKKVHAAAMMSKGDRWTLHEEFMREKEDLRRILKRMEAQCLLLVLIGKDLKNDNSCEEV